MMRRSLAIVLTTVFSWMLILPAVGAGAAADVPVCCRKDGKHKCSMRAASETLPSEVAPATIHEKCPCVPPGMTTGPVDRAVSFTASAIVAAVVSHPAMSPLPVASCRILTSRSHQKRGPPSPLV